MKDGDDAAYAREKLRLDFEREQREQDRKDRREELKMLLETVVSRVSQRKSKL